MTPLLARALVACALSIVGSLCAASPLRLSLLAEGPQDLLLDVVPERPAVSYVPVGQPPLAPDADDNQDQGVALHIEAASPGALLDALAPVPEVPAPAQDDEPVLPRAPVRFDAGDMPGVPAPKDTTTSALSAAATGSLPTVAAAMPDLGRVRTQRHATQWIVVTLVMLSLGLWWVLSRRRIHQHEHRHSTKTDAPSGRGHHRHRHATRRI